MKAVIVDWLRSPFHRAHKGKLSNVRPDEMAGYLAKTILKKNNLLPELVDDILVGCAYPEGEQGYNIGRIMTYLGGLPNSVPGATFNRLCGSSMQAVLSASANIEVGWGECFLCGGVESMSRVKRRGFNWSPNPNLELEFPQAYIGMVETAENIANLWNISRSEQENFALLSHKKASFAQKSGYLEEEIVPINNSKEDIFEDGCIRGTTTLESMSQLSPVLGHGTSITAATASPLTDGASFMIVCSENFAKRNKLTPIARIVSGAVIGCDPEIMGIGPVEASRLALKRAKWTIEDIDIFELNEAFSSQSIAVINELGIDIDKVNVDGGSLAIGHPLGASGIRILGKAASILNRTNGNRALASMCIGGGMGIAITLEKP
ncbi:MAG: thiolase family protein [Candidatus Thalassarchaeaceae archaeon]|jgi:acetyl-CoA acyltransferase